MKALTKTILFFIYFSHIFASVQVEKEEEKYQQFLNWQKTNKIKYNSKEEEDSKFKIFKENSNIVFHTNKLSKKYPMLMGMQLRMNGEYDLMVGLKKEYESLNFSCEPNSAEFSLNNFADITQSEFISKFSDINEETIKKIKEVAIPLEIKNKNVLPRFDLREKGELKIKNIKEAKNFYILKGEGIEENMKAALIEKGPLTVAVPAEYVTFYKRGIMDFWFNNLCSESKTMTLNIIGYDNQCGVDYWLIKTPFGNDWAPQGVLRMRRGINTCRINDFVVFLE